MLLWGFALLAAIALLPPAAVSAQTSSQANTFDVYAGPQRITLPSLAQAGRRLHIVCMGQGAPTILLTAGVGDWSSIWSKVQAPASRRTRVCAWDRAGFGLSDPSPEAQTVDHTVNDMERVLGGAKIRPPYILASHSAGSFETLLFADRHRRDVVGMVLVDPSLPDQMMRLGAISPKALDLSRQDIVARTTRLRACSARPVASCFTYAPEIGEKLKDALTRLDGMPARPLTKASLFENFEASAKLVVKPDRNYGDLPLIVLTSDHPPTSGLPVESAATTQALNSLWNRGHDELAALSQRGANRVVDNTGHAIQQEQPDAVIAALNEMLDRTRP